MHYCRAQWTLCTVAWYTVHRCMVHCAPLHGTLCTQCCTTCVSPWVRSYGRHIVYAAMFFYFRRARYLLLFCVYFIYQFTLHTNTHKHTCTHTPTQTHTYTNTHLHKHTYTNTPTHTHLHTHTHTYAHRWTPTQTHTHTPTHTPTYPYTRTPLLQHTCAYSYEFVSVLRPIACLLCCCWGTYVISTVHCDTQHCINNRWVGRAYTTTKLGLLSRCIVALRKPTNKGGIMWRIVIPGAPSEEWAPHLFPYEE